jgi:DHA2 family multidrug resistance protein
MSVTTDPAVPRQSTGVLADDTLADAERSPPDRRTWIGIIAGMIGGFMALLDIQVINASLNEILGELSATREEGSWIATAYLVAEVIVIPMTPLLTRAFGLRLYMIGTTVMFLIASTLCAWAWSLPSLIVFRALQGFAGGALIPLVMTLVLVKAPEQRRKGMALFALITTLAPAMGPSFGGFLTELYGWRTIFYINWIPGLIMLIGLLYGLRPESRQLRLLPDADWLGIGFMALGLGCLTVMLEEGNAHDWFESPLILTMACLGVIGILGWLTTYALRDKPFIDLSLYRHRRFLIATTLTSISGMALYGCSFLMPLYLGQIPAYSPMQIGEVLMWVGLPQILVMPIGMVMANRIDNRIVCAIGLALFGLSCFMNVNIDATTGYDQLVLSQVIRALGQPLITLTLSNLAMQDMNNDERLSASALYNMMRNLGGAVGIGLLSTALTVREHFHSSRIGETVTSLSTATQSRLDTLTDAYVLHGIEPTRAHQLALQSLDELVRREAYVMAYDDCFWIIGVILISAIGLLLFLARTNPQTMRPASTDLTQ